MKSEYYEAGDFILGAYRMKSRTQKDAAMLSPSARETWRGCPSGWGKKCSCGPEAGLRRPVRNNEQERRRAEYDLRLLSSLFRSLPGTPLTVPRQPPGTNSWRKREPCLLWRDEQCTAGEPLVDEWFRVKLTLRSCAARPLARRWRPFPSPEAGFERCTRSFLVMPLLRHFSGAGAPGRRRSRWRWSKVATPG